MKRFLIDVYIVDIPPTDFRRDDLTEATEDELDRTRDYHCQLQANSVEELVEKVKQLRALS